MLTPQLRAQDRGAWRLRAMILAMNGRDKEATEIVNATMPPAMAQNIMPYLVQMDRLNPAQQAAAAHFGRFPNGQLGPKRQPVQVAAAPPPPSPPPAATSRRPTAGGKRQPITAAPAPVATTRKPDSRLAATSADATTPTPKPSVTSSSPALASARSEVSKPPLAQPSFNSAIRPAPSPSAPVPSSAPVPAASIPTPTPAPPAAAAEPIGTAVDADKGPIGPGFSIADMGRSTAVVSSPTPTPSAIEPATPPSSAVTAAPAPASAAPLASLADIVGSIEIPAEELAQSDSAIGADTLAKLVADKRKADAAEAAKREKDAVAAKAKAEADAKAKEEAAEKKASPARIWVQVATGANAKALATDFGKFAKKSPAVFKGKSGATTEWGKTRRLLVGPFKDRKAAQDWLGDYKKAGGDGFLFNSEAGQSVDPVK